MLAAACPVSSVSPQLPRAAGTKRQRAPRTSEAGQMATSAEQLWSAKTRGLFAFESIAPTNGLPMGAVGVADRLEGPRRVLLVPQAAESHRASRGRGLRAGGTGRATPLVPPFCTGRRLAVREGALPRAHRRAAREDRGQPRRRARVSPAAARRPGRGHGLSLEPKGHFRGGDARRWGSCATFPV